MELNEAISKYEKYIKVTKSEGTLNYFRGKIGIIKRYLGKVDCQAIDQEMILDFIIQQKERNPNISNRTLNKYISTIKQVLKYSCKIKLEFEKMPEIRKIIETIPDELIHRIYAYYQKNQSNLLLERNYIIFRLLNETGLRLNELLNLKVKDFDFKNLSIHVKKTKTNNERYVFFSEETHALINLFIKKSKLVDRLFIDYVTGEPLKDYAVESICQRLVKKLDLPQSISPHKWRHTFATRFATSNGNIEVLRMIMGHSSLRTTQKYLHMNKETLQKEYFRIHNLI